MMKVLIVDDEVILRMLCREILEEIFLDVVEASNGEEAWALFQREKFDLVITDVMMPGALNGLGLAEKIIEDNYAVPVLLMTGFDDKDRMLKAIQIGVSDFIIKPFTNVYFMDRVKRAIDKRNLTLGQLKVIELLHESMDVPKDALIESMSVQEGIEYIHELVAIYTIKKERGHE